MRPTAFPSDFIFQGGRLCLYGKRSFKKSTKKKYGDFAVTDETDLYRDLRFDSLSFICLITEIEDLYDIRFGMTEMEACLRVGKFIELAEQKVGERRA